MQFGSYIYEPGSIAAVGLDDAGTTIEIWPIVCATGFAIAGLALFWEMLDPIGWIMGTGMLLAATALCLCSKSFLYRLTITGSDGAQQSAVSSDRFELDELRVLIQGHLAADAKAGSSGMANKMASVPRLNLLT